MSQLKEILGDYHMFLNVVLEETKDEGFDFKDFIQLDHCCYQCKSLEDYESMGQRLDPHGRCLGEVIISGRSIAVYRLNEYITHSNWRIDCLELAAPKPGIFREPGLDHIEIVVYDDQETFLRKYPKNYDMKAADRGINPEIALELPKYRVKFHWLNIAAAVYIENKLGMKQI